MGVIVKIAIFLLTLVLGIIGGDSWSTFRHKQDIEDARLFREDQNKKMDHVVDFMIDQSLDTKESERLIAEKYKNLFDSFETEAREWAQQLKLKLDEKKKEMESIDIAGRELANKLHLKIKPLYDFVLLDFDVRTDELSDLIEEETKSEQEINLVVKDVVNNPDFKIRSTKFINGNTVHINYRPLLIRRGLIESPGIIYFSELLSNDSHLSVFQIHINEKQAYLNVSSILYQSQIREIQSKGDILDDESFIDGVRNGLSRLIGDAVVNDVREKDS